MNEKTHWIVETIKGVPSSFLLALCIALCVILFVPESIAFSLGIDTFRTAYRVFLGPGLILVASWLLTRGLSHLKRPIAARRAKRHVHQFLSNLTPEEKGYLAPFIIEERNTIHAPIEDGIAGGLVAKRILYRASQVFDMVEGVPYNLNPSAREFLTENPHLLEGAEGKPTTPLEKALGPW